MKKWYVVQARSQQTEIALENLARQGVRTFYPVVAEQRMRNGVPLSTVAPLFKGYIFVQFDITHALWRRISGTKGVAALLTATEDRCTAVPKGFVEALIRQADRKGMLTLPQVQGVVETFKPGQALYITEGIFEGMEGICEKLTKNTAILITALLNGGNRLTLPRNILSPHAPI